MDFPKHAAAALIVGVFAVLIGCSSREGPPQSLPSELRPISPGLNVALSQFPGLPDSILPVTVPNGMSSFADGLSDDQLVEEVRRAGGMVGIGLKPALSYHTQRSRVLPGMNRGSVLVARVQLEARGVEILKTFRKSSAMVGRIAPESAPALRRLAVVNYIHPIREGYPLVSTPLSSINARRSPPLYPPQDTSWGVHKIGADSVWQYIGYRGEYANVTMIDFGPYEQQWANSGLDGPNNLVECLYVAPLSTCWMTISPHGSFVAGIINGRNNEAGYIGIAHQLERFVAINVFTHSAATNSAMVAHALDWAEWVGYPRHIVNISIGFCFDQPILAEQIVRAASAGILIIAAAGNTRNVGLTKCEEDGSPLGATQVLYPARYPLVVAVSGTMQDDSFAETPNASPCNDPLDGGSRFGPEVDISAPFWAHSIIGGASWGILCGTSFAAPVVSAVAALVWSKNTSWSAIEVRDRLIYTASVAGPPEKFGYGRVSAMRAVADDPPPPSFSLSITGPSVIHLSATCQWFAAVDGDPGPLDFEWKVNGQPYGGNTQIISYNNTGPFILEVKATDQIGASATATHSVAIQSGYLCT
jgi:hypothetical protein